jgi:hypothetical protein
MTPLFAQSLGEYSALSGLASSAMATLDSAQDWVFHQNPQVVIAVGVVLLLFVVSRAFRSRRF